MIEILQLSSRGHDLNKSTHFTGYQQEPAIRMKTRERESERETESGRESGRERATVQKG